MRAVFSQFEWSERFIPGRPVAVAVGHLQLALANVVRAAAFLREVHLSGGKAQGDGWRAEGKGHRRSSRLRPPRTHHGPGLGVVLGIQNGGQLGGAALSAFTTAVQDFHRHFDGDPVQLVFDVLLRSTVSVHRRRHMR